MWCFTGKDIIPLCICMLLNKHTFYFHCITIGWLDERQMGGSKAACGSIWQWKFRLLTDVMSNNEWLRNLYTYYVLRQKLLPKKNPEITKHIRKAIRNVTTHQVNVFPSPTFLLFIKEAKGLESKFRINLINFGHFCRQTNPARGRYDALAVPGRWNLFLESSKPDIRWYLFPYYFGFGWARMPGKYSFF